MRRFNAVFQGGGVRGIGLVGALTRVQEEDIEFAGVAGTSAGAIVAALYAAGYRVDELKQLLSVDFRTLLDPAWPKTYHLWRSFGIYKGRKLYEWIYGLLAAKGIATFSDLRDKDLKIIASDITNKDIIIFDQGRHPAVEVAEAVRMSVSIPLFFQAYKWGKRLVVDGGLLSNYPLWIFANTPLPTLGFRLVSREQTRINFAPNSVISYMSALVSTMLEAHDKESEKRIGSERTIHIPTGDIATTNFALTEDQKNFLYNAGYLAAAECVKSQPDLFHPAAPAKKQEVLGEVFESMARLTGITREFVEDGYKVLDFSREVLVDRPNIEANAIEHLINASGEPKTGIVRGMVADNPVEFDNLNFQATFDMGEGETAAAFDVEPSNDRRSHKVRLSFRGHVLSPGAKITLKWRFQWPGAISRREDYWLFPVGYALGEDAKLIIKILFKENPADYGFFAVRENGLQPVNIAGPKLDNLDGAVLYAYQVELKSPSGIYAFRWRMPH
jgi:NTE family protein